MCLAAAGAGGECSWHSPAGDKAIKHGLVWPAEKMPLSVPIYCIRCQGPQRGRARVPVTKGSPALAATQRRSAWCTRALRATRLVSGHRVQTSRGHRIPKVLSPGGLGKSQGQRSVPRLLEKSPSCLHSCVQSSNVLCRALSAGSSTSTAVAPSTSPGSLFGGGRCSSPQVLVPMSPLLSAAPWACGPLSLVTAVPACAGDLPARP